MRRSSRSRGYRASLAISILTVFVATGCGTTGQTIGAALGGTGLAAVGAGTILAVGCSTPDPNNPAIEQRSQPCMPADTYETYKPAILTGIALGVILIGAGVAIYSVSSPAPATSTPPPRPPPPPESEEAEPQRSCRDYCF